MFFIKKSIKSVMCLSALMLVSAVQAQKMADLLVTKEAKPGQWLSTPTQFPKELAAHMKTDNFCASKEELQSYLNRSIDMMSGANTTDNASGNSCSTNLVSDTSAEAVMKIKCSFKSMGVNTESTYSIKRTSNNTWAFALSGFNGNGAMSTVQTTMKYLGACSK